MDNLNFIPIQTHSTKDNSKRNLVSEMIKQFSRFNPLAKVETKWIILVLTCLVGIGNLYCFDLPGALKSIIQLNFLHLSEDEFDLKISMMYSCYSIPNIIIPLISGGLINKYGFRKMLIVFTLLITLGQTIFTFGIFMRNIPLAFFGRVVFGMGGESLSTSQNMFIITYFSSKEIALMFGFIAAVNRFSSFFTDVLSPKIGTKYDLLTALITGLSISIFSFFIGIILLIVDKYSLANESQRGQEKKEITDTNLRSYEQTENSDVSSDIEKASFNYVKIEKKDNKMYNNDNSYKHSEAEGEDDIEERDDIKNINKSSSKDISFFEAIGKLDKVSFL